MTNLKKYYEHNSKINPLKGNSREYGLLKQIKKTIKIKKGKIIDIGCGDGFLLHNITGNYKKFGLDFSQNRLTTCKQINPDVKIIKHSLEKKLPFKDGEFDLVICSEVLEHVPTYKKVIKELSRITKKCGQLIITVPNEENIQEIFCPHCTKKFFHMGHCNSISKTDILKILKKNSINKIKKFDLILFETEIKNLISILFDIVTRRKHRKFKRAYLLISFVK